MTDDTNAMTPSEYPLHDSQRGWFGRAVYFEMQRNRDVFLLTADLGFRLFDLHQRDFPDRFVNTGAAECAMIGAGIGLAQSGKLPFCYSITPFLLYRPFEWIRNYLHHENAPVLLVGSGLDDDYKHDGQTHHAFDAKAVLALFPRIRTYFPADKSEIPDIVSEMVEYPAPSFLCLRR